MYCAVVHRSRKQAQHSSSGKAKQQKSTAQSGVPLAPSTGTHRQLNNTRQHLSDVTNCLGTALGEQGLAYMNADQDYSQNSNTDGSSADLYV